jgi:putative GTP pyrophosphokinase
LDYKSEQDIPTDLKRDFHALSGLFYVADKHFEMFFRSRQASVQEVKILSDSDLFLVQEINFDTLSEYLVKKYSDRDAASTTQISKLVASLRDRGLRTLGDLDALLDKKTSYLAQREKEGFPKKRTRFNRVGAIRISFAMDTLFEPDHLRPQLPDYEKRLKEAKGQTKIRNKQLEGS